jgi:drug/metabolite transporter (DMT)-like permease
VTERPARAEVALAAATVAVLAWSFGPIIVRTVGVSTPTVVFWRMWLAQPVMIGAAYLAGGRLSMPLLRRAFLPGVLFGLSIITGFASYKTTSVANATLIANLQPALVLFVAPKLFGERVTKRQISFAVAAFGGILLVVFGASSSSGAALRGDLLAAANLVIFTVYFVRMKQIRDDGVHAYSLIASVFLVGALTVTPWSVLASHDLGSVNLRGYGLLLLMVLGPGLLGHGTMTWAQRHLDITVASMLTLLSPVLSTIWAWAIYEELLAPVQALGAVVVLGALAGIVVDARRDSVELEAALSGVAE